MGKKKQSKQSPRLLLRDAEAIDSEVVAEEKKRRAVIRHTLKNLQPRQGWLAVKTTLQDHISEKGFYRLKKELQKVNGDVNRLEFPQLGRPRVVNAVTTKKLAIASMEQHIEGDQMTVIPAKKFLEAESGTVINTRQLKTALGNLDTGHRISLATTQKLTA